jgi:thiamine-phosphate pyrophosphorylase
MNTLAIDIGGTKFALALFEDERLIKHERQATHRAGGSAWMLEKIGSIAGDWTPSHPIHRCGIGFGGPVQFDAQRVVMSTHVPGWIGCDLPREVQKFAGVLPVMDNDANLGALGEALYGAGCSHRPLFYLTLSTGIGGGIITAGDTVYRGADSYAGEIGHLTIRVPMRFSRLFRANVLRLVAGARLRTSGRGVASGAGLRGTLRGRSRARLEGCHHVAESGAHRHRRRNRKGRRRALRSIARGTTATDHRLVSRANRRGSCRVGRRQRSLWRIGVGCQSIHMTLPPFYPVLDTGLFASRGLTAVESAEAILEAGARILQFRHKQYFSRSVFEEAEHIAGLCRAAGALFVMNDRADFAALLGAALHLGQDDLAPADARKIMPPGAIIGFSTHNERQFRDGDFQPADYLAIGPIFTTSSKQNPDPVVGPDQLRSLRPITRKPLVAVGGITRDSARAVLDAGADSLAVIGDLYPQPLTKPALRKRAEEWLAICSRT